MTMIFGIPLQALHRPVADRPDQRLVLCAAQPRPRHHLRPAARHQLRPWRAIHARRLRRLSAAAYLGIGYWPSLILAPVIVGLAGAVVERLFLRRLYDLDPLYGLLFTFGLALAVEGTFRYLYGSSGQPYAQPAALAGAPISASCSCRSTAAGLWSCRLSSASARGC
jgi:hypothetical protein